MEQIQTPDPLGPPVDPAGPEGSTAEPSKVRKVLIGAAATAGAFIGSAALVTVAANAFQSSSDTPAVQQGQPGHGQAGQGQAGQGQAGQGQAGQGQGAGQPPGRGQRPTAPGGSSSQQDGSGSGTRTVPQGPSMGVPGAGGPTSRSRAS